MGNRFARIAHCLMDVIHHGPLNRDEIKPIDPTFNPATRTEVDEICGFEPADNILGRGRCCNLAPAALKKQYWIASNLREEVFAVGRGLARNVGKYSFH